MVNTQKFVAKYNDSIKCFKYRVEDDCVVVCLCKGATEDFLMSEWGLAKYFVDEGFEVSFTTGDFEYITKPVCYNHRGMDWFKGHKAYLRNRLIMTIK